MTTSHAVRDLFRVLARSTETASWLILNPHLVQRSAWTAHGEEIRLAESNLIPVLSAIPTSTHPVTDRMPWAKNLARVLIGPCHESEREIVLPFGRDGSVFALLGFRASKSSNFLSGPSTQMSVIREAFRTWQIKESTRAETAALRWLLDRCDRALAMAAPGGHVLDATPLGRDALKSMMFGQRHYFRPDRPELPVVLLKEVGTMVKSSQVTLGKRGTARLDEVALPGSECRPLIAIEFFVETAVQPPLPLSLLTSVERDVLELIRKGGTNKEIAAQRGKSPATIKNQVSQILGKTGYDRRGELIAAALNLPPVGVD
jgi:DNA-binding CsgD family transcriptional regulator